MRCNVIVQVGDTFAAEASIDDVQILKAPYIEMHKILEQVRMKLSFVSVQCVAVAICGSAICGSVIVCNVWQWVMRRNTFRQSCT